LVRLAYWRIGREEPRKADDTTGELEHSADEDEEVVVAADDDVEEKKTEETTPQGSKEAVVIVVGWQRAVPLKRTSPAVVRRPNMDSKGRRRFVCGFVWVGVVLVWLEEEACFFLGCRSRSQENRDFIVFSLRQRKKK
jgi:hypothetical protein